MTDMTHPVTATPDLNRRLADYAMVLDLMGTLPGEMDELKVIDSIRTLFTLLCAPAQTLYVPYVNNMPDIEHCYPEGRSLGPVLRAFLADASCVNGGNDSGSGFLLRFVQGGETLGVLEIDGVAFPQYKAHYLNLGLTIVRVCGLAIHNARIYGRLRDTIGERERAEQRIRQLNGELERRILQVEATNRELESFSYSVSHDLRAPLRGIEGLSAMLQEEYGGTLDATARGYLKMIREGTHRMDDLIKALLELARVSRSELHSGPVGLSELYREVEHELRLTEPERRVDIEVEPNMTVQGDRALLRSMVHNLLENAWKFTRHRTLARIACGRQDRSGVIQYFVRDNGAGFDMTHASKLFTPFQRLHAGKEFSGTGIGLSTVQRIIHRHGGRVWAEGVVGQGATFYFTLNESVLKS